MDKQEVGQLLNYVKAAYPLFLKENDPKVIFELWSDVLKDCEFTEVMQNLKTYAKGNKWPPTISDLITTKSKYPGHTNAGDIVKRVEEFKKHKGQPPTINIRDFLGGKD